VGDMLFGPRAKPLDGARGRRSGERLRKYSEATQD